VFGLGQQGHDDHIEWGVWRAEGQAPGASFHACLVNFIGPAIADLAHLFQHDGIGPRSLIAI
jgi:hypothetical protein